jgi:hypothetical protein
VHPVKRREAIVELLKKAQSASPSTATKRMISGFEVA